MSKYDLSPSLVTSWAVKATKSVPVGARMCEYAQLRRVLNVAQKQKVVDKLRVPATLKPWRAGCALAESHRGVVQAYRSSGRSAIGSGSVIYVRCRRVADRGLLLCPHG